MEQARLLGERYELSDVLGRGGMAEVRLARDIRLGRTVAVKTLRSDLALDSTFQARFRREAQSAASLNHPSIVSVYDTGEDYADGTPVPYIVMEYVDGQTLRELLSSGRKLLPERALEIAAGTLAALDYSHHNGIVHRDIKPGNVMLTRAGTVKVMDFGIARAVADASSTMTATAAVIGTAQYLSPEQAKGEKVDARSDLYSAGCLLYELLTGEPPFTGDSPVSVAYQHVREQPKPPSSLDAHVTPDMDAIVLKALAKNADNRYQSAGEMREDIERTLAGAPVTAPAVMTDAVTEQVTRRSGPPTTAMPAATDDERGGRRWLGLALLFLGVLAAVGVGIFVSNELFGGPDGEQVAVPDVVNLTIEEATEDLERSGLTPEVQYVNDPNVDEDRVIEQDPAAAETVTRGDSVTLVVSGGEVRAIVPDLVGLPVADARRQLREAKLAVGQVTNRASDRPEGEVLATTPRANASRDPGSRVDLVVSTGVPLVEVPNVVGLPYATALATVNQAGFEVPSQPSFEISEQVPEGAVLRQVPEAGARIPEGSRVTFVLAQAPPAEQPPPVVEPEPTPEEPVEEPPEEGGGVIFPPPNENQNEASGEGEGGVVDLRDPQPGNGDPGAGNPGGADPGTGQPPPPQ